MEINYILTDDEIAFLKALAEKEYPKNSWSGRSSDDNFRSKWKKEITIFQENGLTEKKDDGHFDSFWCYGLNEKGLFLQKKYI